MGRKIFFVAVNTGFASNGQPSERCIDFYRERSGLGLYCSLVGNVVVPDGVASNETCARISTDEVWGRLAAEIRLKGAKPGIQLASAWQGYKGIRKFVPANKAAAHEEYLRIGHQLGPDDAHRAFDALGHGSTMSVAHGFAHVQLHAAHGYLFNLLLDEHFAPNAFASAHTRAAAWAQQMKRLGVETSIRVSMTTGSRALDRTRKLTASIQPLIAIGVDYIDLSDGFYNIDKRIVYPSGVLQLEGRVARSVRVAESWPDQQFIASGKILDRLDDSAPKNLHLGLCRDLIANPKFLEDRKLGCTNCMKCHYYSRGERELTCGRWRNADSEDA